MGDPGHMPRQYLPFAHTVQLWLGIRDWFTYVATLTMSTLVAHQEYACVAKQV